MKITKKLRAALAALCFAAPGIASATEILFAFVEDTPPYVPDGQQLAAMIGAVPGFNVTQRFSNRS